MVMHDPAHPGEVIRELRLEPLGLSVTDAARGGSQLLQSLAILVSDLLERPARCWKGPLKIFLHDVI